MSPVFLLYSDSETDHNASGRDCVLVDAADESAARAAIASALEQRAFSSYSPGAAAARAALHTVDGGTRVPASWKAINLSTSFPPAGFVFLQGRVAEPLRPPRGH